MASLKERLAEIEAQNTSAQPTTIWIDPRVELPAQLTQGFLSEQVLLRVVHSGSQMITVGSYDCNREDFATQMGRYPIGYVLAWSPIPPLDLVLK